MFLNIIVLVTTRLSICYPPSIIRHSQECFCILFYLVHILNGICSILFETKVKIRIKYSIHSSATRWETWKMKHYLALSRDVPED